MSPLAVTNRIGIAAEEKEGVADALVICQRSGSAPVTAQAAGTRFSARVMLRARTQRGSVHARYVARSGIDMHVLLPLLTHRRCLPFHGVVRARCFLWRRRRYARRATTVAGSWRGSRPWWQAVRQGRGRRNSAERRRRA